jgi:hypothetical protein
MEAEILEGEFLRRKEGYSWQWKRRRYWIDYGATEQSLLEDAHKSGSEGPVALTPLSARATYTVDMKTLVQTNDNTGKAREIRRFEGNFAAESAKCRSGVCERFMSAIEG